MRIQKIQTNKNNYHNTTFKSWNRTVYKELYSNANPAPRKIAHRNDTRFYRDGEFWKDACAFFVNKFKDVDKVNVYSYACSDGSEPLTFVMQLLSNYSQNIANKFFPVEARDIDVYAILKAKSKDYTMNSSEIYDINKFTNHQFLRYFCCTSQIENNKGEKPYDVSKELTNNINYDVKDINIDYVNIKPENSIVFARNFWPYMENWTDRRDLLYKLSSQMGKNSYLVIGDFDNVATDWKLISLIIDAGFSFTPLSKIFKKSCE